MKSLRIYPSSINDRYIEEACEALRAGEIIIYPTDTLYAVGCDALNQAAIDKLCRFKGLNTQKNTLSVICADISQASDYARIDNRTFKLLRQYCPGPFTFLLPATASLPKAFKGRKVVGLRIPDNAIATELARRLGHPLLTSSLPSEGLDEEEITAPGEIMLRYDNSPIPLMIDGGRGQSRQSTIVDLTDSSAPEITREGLGKFEG